MNDLPIVNIASHVGVMADKQPHRLAVVFPHGRDAWGRVSYTHYTFRQLHAASDRLAWGLQAVGVGRGTRTVLMVKPSLEFFALTFALFKLGAAPVLVDPGMGVKNLGKCLAEAEPEAFIGVTKAHLARCLLGWARASVRVNVTVGRRLFWGGSTLRDVWRAGQSEPFPLADTRADTLAAILFTSGSTGVPKGAVYTHGIFTAQVETLRDLYGIEPGEVDLATFPLFALFGPALGMTSIVPDMDATRPALVDPKKIIEAVEDFGATNMFGSPALLNRVSRYGVEHGVKLPSLRRVLSAGAPVAAAILERFRALLAPGVQIYTPYGATEALPVCSIGSDEILNETRARTAEGGGVCVGRPVPGVDLRVIRISDDPLPTWGEELCVPLGEIGEIAVRGPAVTREYYRRPQSTASAKIVDAKEGGFYHRMGDLGYLDDRGRVWFCGRKSQRVRTAAGDLYTIPCEAVFNEHPDVFRTALVGVGEAGSARPVLCVERKPECRGRPEAEVTRELLALGEKHAHTRAIQTILYHPAFPVDIRHNAKIFREKLAVWAAGRLA